MKTLNMMLDKLSMYGLLFCALLFQFGLGKNIKSNASVIPNIEESFECDLINGTCCAVEEFQCHDGACVPVANFCDSNLHSGYQNASLKLDCKDGSDELGCADTLCELREHKCEQMCVELSNNKSRCFCDDGYIPQSSPKGLVCVDIDECKQGIHSCSQICTNTNGSYTCSCEEGFYLDEKGGYIGRCIEEDTSIMILFNVHQWINGFDLERKEIKELIPAGKVDSMDYDPVTDMIYWWNNHQKTLSRSFMPSHDNNVTIGHEQKVCVTYQDHPVARKDITIDWTLGNIYWISISRYGEGMTSSIIVSKLNKVAPRTLFFIKDVAITSLVLDPMDGKLYWTIARKHESEINFSYSNAISKKAFIKIYKQHITALALDKVDNRLYWYDRKSKSMFSILKKGSQPKKILKLYDDQIPLSMDVFGNHIYWVTKSLESVPKKGQLVRFNKFGGSEVEILYDGLIGQSSIKIYHKKNITKYLKVDLQSLREECQSCEHLCFRQHNGVSCTDMDDSENLQEQESCLKVNHGNFHGVHPLKCNCRDKHKVCNVSSPHNKCHCKNPCQIIGLKKYTLSAINRYFVVSVVFIFLVITCFILSFYAREEIRKKVKSKPIQLQIVN